MGRDHDRGIDLRVIERERFVEDVVESDACRHILQAQRF
jgi:hypothetical protein